MRKVIQFQQAKLFPAEKIKEMSKLMMISFHQFEHEQFKMGMDSVKFWIEKQKVRPNLTISFQRIDCVVYSVGDLDYAYVCVPGFFEHMLNSVDLNKVPVLSKDFIISSFVQIYSNFFETKHIFVDGNNVAIRVPLSGEFE